MMKPKTIQATSPASSIETWEEVVESIPSVSHDGDKPTEIPLVDHDGLEEVLILDTKVTYQNNMMESSVITAAATENQSMPCCGSVGLLDDNIASESTHDSPRCSTDIAMMSAISELSFHPSDVSLSAVEDYSSVWKKNDQDDTQELILPELWPEDFSPVHATISSGSFFSSTLPTPLLEPFVPSPVARANESPLPEATYSEPNTEGLIAYKQEYDRNAFVRIANCLDFEQGSQAIPTESIEGKDAYQMHEQEERETQHDHKANDHLVQDFVTSDAIFQSKSEDSASPLKQSLPSIKACVVLAALALLAVMVVIFGPSVAHHPFAILVAEIDPAIYVEPAFENDDVNHTFGDLETTFFDNWQVWNATSTPIDDRVENPTIVPFPSTAAAREGDEQCGGSNEAPSWGWKMTYLLSLATFVLKQIRRKFKEENLSEEEECESEEVTREAVSISSKRPVLSTKTESVVFCEGERKITQVKVEVTHHTSSSHVEKLFWDGFDLSNYTKLRVVDLKERLRTRQCKVSGLKIELILRLVESYVLAFESMTVKELREVLRSNGLKVSDRKQDLIRRLVEAGVN